MSSQKHSPKLRFSSQRKQPIRTQNVDKQRNIIGQLTKKALDATSQQGELERSSSTSSASPNETVKDAEEPQFSIDVIKLKSGDIALVKVLEVLDSDQVSKLPFSSTTTSEQQKQQTETYPSTKDLQSTVFNTSEQISITSEALGNNKSFESQQSNLAMPDVNENTEAKEEESTKESTRNDKLSPLPQGTIDIDADRRSAKSLSSRQDVGISKSSTPASKDASPVHQAIAATETGKTTLSKPEKEFRQTVASSRSRSKSLSRLAATNNSSALKTIASKNAIDRSNTIKLREPVNPATSKGVSATKLRKFASENDVSAKKAASEFQELMNKEEPDLLLLDPNHPLLQRYQAKMKKHFNELSLSLTFQIKDSEELIKKKLNERDSLTMDVSRVLDTLKGTRGSLESTEKDLSDTKDLRDSESKQLEALKTQESKLNSSLLELRSKERSLYDEVETLNRQLFHLSEKSFSPTNETKVVKNAAKKAQTDLAITEEEKKRQDEIISRQMHTTLRVEEDVSQIESQIQSIEEQLFLRREALAKVKTEIQALSSERKRTLDYWNSAVIGLRKRDEAIKLLKSDIAQTQSESAQIESEINTRRKAQKSQEFINSKLTLNLAFAERQIEKVEQTIEELRAENTELEKQSNEQRLATQHLSKDVVQKTQEKNQLQQSASLLEHRIRQERQMLRSLENESFEAGLKTAGKSNASSAKEATLRKLRQTNEDLERTVAELDSALSSQQESASEIDGRLKALQATQEEMKKETDRVGKEVSQAVVEEERLAALEKKKRSKVDQLKRKLASRLSTKTESKETTTVGDGAAFQMQKETKVLDAKLAQLQADYIKLQEQQIKLLGADDNVIQGLQEGVTQLEQKRMRLDDQQKADESEIVSLRRNIQSMHIQLIKTNELIGKKSAHKELLEKHSLTVQGSLYQRLKDLELEVIQLEETIANARSEKEAVAGNIVEAQQQLALWEQKLAAAKDARAKVDKGHGKEEIQQLRAGIHRMQTKHSQLVKQQEQMIREMEKSVIRREALINKSSFATQSKSSSSRTSPSPKQKLELENLELTIEMLQTELTSLNNEMLELNQKSTEMAAEIQTKRLQEDSFLESIKQQEAAIANLTAKNEAISLYTDIMQRQQRTTEEANEYVPRFRADATIQQKFRKEQLKKEQKKGLIQMLKQQFPELGTKLNKLEAFAELCT